jgi:branched-chain amino acid transport system ATP-binding protein
VNERFANGPLLHLTGVTLIGANGAGKSTLMMTICGNPRARSGRVAYAGEDITHLPTHAIMRRGVAVAPEGRRIFPRMTVRENLLMGAQAVGIDDAEPRLTPVFALFPHLEKRLHQRGGTLMSGPRLLLLDEPSLGLAPLIVRQIFAAIRDLNRRTGLTVLLVEQNAYQALRLAHRGYVLVNGAITMSGSGSELLHRPDVRAAYLEGAS